MAFVGEAGPGHSSNSCRACATAAVFASDAPGAGGRARPRRGARARRPSASSDATSACRRRPAHARDHFRPQREPGRRQDLLIREKERESRAEPFDIIPQAWPAAHRRSPWPAG